MGRVQAHLQGRPTHRSRCASCRNWRNVVQANRWQKSWTAKQEEVVAGALGCQEPSNVHPNNRIKNKLERRSKKTREEVVAAIEIEENQS